MPDRVRHDGQKIKFVNFIVTAKTAAEKEIERLQLLQSLKKNSAVWRMACGAAMISFSSVWVKLAHVTPAVSGFYRSFFGAICLTVITAWMRQFKWRGWKPVLLAFVCGVFLALDLFFWHTAIHLIGPGLATLLGNLDVFFLAVIGALFLGEKLGIRFPIAVVMAILGLLLIVGVQWDQLGPAYRTGIVLGLLTAIVYTGFLLTLKKLQSDQAAGSVFYVLMLLSWSTTMLLGIPAGLSGASFRIPDLQSWLSLLALGLLSQVVGWILITRALPRVRTSLIGLILLLQPSLSFVWDVVIFQRQTTTVNWLGVIMVLVAIYLGIAKEPG
jgi:drug/metabolite transporter (DMT)-like permease